MSVLQRLTEGVVTRNVQKEGEALLTKWEQTGLLEGLNEGQQKQGMAVLLENQAKELLREASSMAAGDVEGFAAVAFPIVRRVFGGLIANDLVSVQPMSLPSGLIFFLDFTHEESRLGASGSVYGGNVIGREVTGGVDLSGDGAGPGGHFELGNGYSAAHSASVVVADTDIVGPNGAQINADATLDLGAAGIQTSTLGEGEKKAIRYDADLLALPGSTRITIADVALTAVPNLDQGALSQVDCVAGATDNFTSDLTAGNVHLVRRLTSINGTDLRLVFIKTNGEDFDAVLDGASLTLSYPIKDSIIANPAAVGGVVGSDPWNLEEPADGTGNSSRDGAEGITKNQIAEIDIKVDSIAVTAQTKKLKAKWSPELGQDLNAYHNLDAEVELTGILSEQIALEIDRELLGELVNGATAGTRYWSRAPGLFVDSSGAETGANSAAPDFTGTVSEWYETLIETINDVSAQIHRKTLRGGANFVVCSPEVANILEFTSGFRASVTADQDRGTIGAVKAGSLSKKFDVYVDPYFLRNVLLVGRKGSSFLESGFVYAPYVPLQVTPTIFGTEDFVPRKGVMTRYAKKMVRPDMYGLVVVRGLLGESGG